VLLLLLLLLYQTHTSVPTFKKLNSEMISSSSVSGPPAHQAVTCGLLLSLPASAIAAASAPACCSPNGAAAAADCCCCWLSVVVNPLLLLLPSGFGLGSTRNDTADTAVSAAEIQYTDMGFPSPVAHNSAISGAAKLPAPNSALTMLIRKACACGLCSACALPIHSMKVLPAVLTMFHDSATEPKAAARARKLLV
jgi:hypothetical protein